jgi:hypothetical protein
VAGDALVPCERTGDHVTVWEAFAMLTVVTDEVADA